MLCICKAHFTVINTNLLLADPGVHDHLVVTGWQGEVNAVGRQLKGLSQSRCNHVLAGGCHGEGLRSGVYDVLQTVLLRWGWSGGKRSGGG